MNYKIAYILALVCTFVLTVLISRKLIPLLKRFFTSRFNSFGT